jgi:RNA polymerase sigma-70 factor, ECF subfamily
MEKTSGKLESREKWEGSMDEVGAISVSKIITKLLEEWRNGDQAALEKLMSVVYKELHQMAKNYLKSERPNHTLQTTALVHEAYLRLIDQREVRCENEADFYRLAAMLMRRILVDYANTRRTKKRGGGLPRVTLNEASNIASEDDLEILVVHDALKGLAAIDERKSKIVELRFFGGLTIEKTAEVLGISLATANREWSLARTWLYNEIRKESPI